MDSFALQKQIDEMTRGDFRTSNAQLPQVSFQNISTPPIRSTPAKSPPRKSSMKKKTVEKKGVTVGF